MAERSAPIVPARPATMPAAAIFDEQAIALLASRREGRLSTVSENGEPHVVPVCFVFDDGVIFIALDTKPKKTPVRQLKRVRNILSNPKVAFLVDVYSEDWARLSFLLTHGTASLIEPEQLEHAKALALLRAKYPQYRTMPLEELPVIAINAEAATLWRGGTAEGEEAPTREALDLAGVIRGRRSVRQYKDQPVPRAIIERVLAAGSWAPSPHGRQPWRFAVLTSAAQKLKLADAMGAEWRRNLALDGQDQSIIEIRLEKSYQRVLRAPVIIIPGLYLEELDRYPDEQRAAAEEIMAIQSLGAAAQNILLSAYSLGLDGGWMCAPLFCPEVVVGALGLDPALIPHAMLTIGYAAADPKRRERLPLNDLIVLFD